MKIKNIRNALLLGLGMSMTLNVNAYDSNMSPSEACLLSCYYSNQVCVNQGRTDCAQTHWQCRRGC